MKSEARVGLSDDDSYCLENKDEQEETRKNLSLLEKTINLLFGFKEISD